VTTSSKEYIINSNRDIPKILEDIFSIKAQSYTAECPICHRDEPYYLIRKCVFSQYQESTNWSTWREMLQDKVWFFNIRNLVKNEIHSIIALSSVCKSLEFINFC